MSKWLKGDKDIMKIGVMGLGNIALKAYVPVMNDMRHEVTWHFYSRNETKINYLAKQYGWKHSFSDFDLFLASGIEACFVHTPTNTHGELIKKLLLAGIHVFVDKPISEDYSEVVELQDLAAEGGLILRAGFNRRFAPLNQKVKAVPSKKMIIVQKNRQQPKAKVKFELFDMMIHMTDTALYLLDEPVQSADYQVVAKEDGTLLRSMIIFKTENTTAIAATNMEAGAHTETVEIQSPQGTYHVADLNQLTKNELGVVTVESFGDWENTLSKRGFTQMIRSFIAEVKDSSHPKTEINLADLRSHDYVNRLYQDFLQD